MKRIMWAGALLVLCGTAGAQVTLIAHTGAAGDKSAATRPINASGANFIAVCYSGGGSRPTETISDSQGNAYSLAASGTSGYVVSDLWINFGGSMRSAMTFSASGQDPEIDVQVFSGVANGPEQKVSGSSAGGPSPQAVSASRELSPSVANELILSCFTTNNGSPTSLTVNSPLALSDYTYSTGTGMMSGSAYQIQTSAANVTPTWVTGTGNGTALAAISLRSTATPGPLSLASRAMPPGNLTLAYDFCLQATGGDSPYTWTQTSGNLPAGLRFSRYTGCVTGTPTARGTYPGVSFEVTDHAANTSRTPMIDLVVNNAPPQIASGHCAGGTQYRSYAGCVLTATGGTPPYVWSAVSAGARSRFDPLPEGLTIDSSTGAISSSYILGMGVYNTEITLTDSTGATAHQERRFAMNGNTSFLASPPFPADSIWTQNISRLPVDASPAAVPLPGVHLQAVFGSNVDDGGIPVIQVPSTQPTVSTTLKGGAKGMFDRGPWPSGAPIEGSTNCEQNGGGSDCHSLVILLNASGAPASGWEMYQATEMSAAAWQSTSQGYYSFMGYGLYTQDSGQGTDAAGLPIAPLLANYDAVMSPGGQKTPLRMTLNPSRTLAKHVWPATAQAGGGYTSGGYEDGNGLISQLKPPARASTDRVPFGEIYRITAVAYASPPAACLTNTAANPQASSLFRQMRNYGIINADNGSSSFIGIVGTNDARWNDDDLACLKSLTGSDFEPVNVQVLARDWPGTSKDHPGLGTSQVIGSQPDRTPESAPSR